MNNENQLDLELEDDTVHVLTPGPTIEANIMNTLEWGALTDRIIEDVQDHDLSLEDTLEIWDQGLASFISFNTYFTED